MVNDMRPLITAAGVSTKALTTQDLEIAEKAPEAMINEAEAWLRGIYEGEFKELRRIWNLCTPVVWKRMEHMGCGDEHREIRMLRQQRHKVRGAIATLKRPEFFKVTLVKELEQEKTNAKE
jgi:hypothetical protein